MNLLQLAWRGLRRRPGYATGVVLTLGLGFAVVIAMFTALYGVALKPLQYPQGERVLWLSSSDAGRGLSGNMLSGIEASTPLPANAGIEAFGSFFWNGATFVGGAEPKVLTGANVGGQFFDVFAMPPLLGRWLNADDAGQARLVLGHGTWLELTGADPDIIGKTLRFEGWSAEVVGVMPAAFDVPVAGIGFWSPIDFAESARDQVVLEQARYFFGVARARPGTSLEQINAGLASHSKSLAERFPGSHSTWSLQAQSWHERLVGGVRPVLLALFLVGLLVLLLATGNVVNLMVARGLQRLHELSVHQALGASQRAIGRLLLAESALLVAAAVVLGLGVAALGLKLWIGLADSGLPRAADIHLDWPVVALVLLTALVVVLLTSGCSLWLLRRAAPASQLRGRGAGLAQPGNFAWLVRLLPGLGVAMSTAALATAAVVGLSVQRLAEVQTGFASDTVAAVHGFRGGGPDTFAQTRLFAEQLLESAQATGARNLAIMSSPPLSGVGYIPVDVQLPGQNQPLQQQPLLRAIVGDALTVLDIPLRAGRKLQPTDRDGSARVAMVSEAFARAAFPNQSALGQQVRIPPYGSSGEMLEFEIVGIFADIRSRSAAREVQQEIWLPFAQYTTNSMALIASGGLPAAALLKPLQEAFWRLDRNQGIYRAYTLDQELDAALATPRFFARNAGSFALLALLLGTVGIYGVVAFDLAQRRRDLALRAALGANPRALGGWIVGKGVRTLVGGLLMGAALGWTLIIMVRSALFGIGDAGVPALAAAATLVSCTTLAVCLWLAREAAHTDPMQALRSE